MRRGIATLLVRLYPSNWRNEYGAELLDVLLRRPLRVGTAVNVALAAARQRLANGPVWSITGSAFLLYVLVSLAESILHPPSFSDRLPHMYVAYFLFAIAGFLTPERPGEAAVKTMLLGAWPLTVLGVLNASGVIGQFVLAPGDVPTTFAEHGWAFATYHAAHRSTSPYAILLMPFFLIPYALACGGIGALIARKFSAGTGARAKS